MRKKKLAFVAQFDSLPPKLEQEARIFY